MRGSHRATMRGESCDFMSPDQMGLSPRQRVGLTCAKMEGRDSRTCAGAAPADGPTSVSVVDPAALGAGQGGAEAARVLAQGLSGSAVGATPAHRDAPRLRWARPYRRAHREPQ